MIERPRQSENVLIFNFVLICIGLILGGILDYFLIVTMLEFPLPIFIFFLIAILIVSCSIGYGLILWYYTTVKLLEY